MNYDRYLGYKVKPVELSSGLRHILTLYWFKGSMVVPEVYRVYRHRQAAHLRGKLENIKNEIMRRW